jgi:UDP-glucose 4-epimerase
MHRERTPSSRKPVLITGGLGFVGGHLVDSLIETGVGEVRVFDNRRRAVTDPKDWPNEAVTLIEGDIRDRSELAAAIEDCDLVYHLAAQSNVMGAVSDPDYAVTTNVGGTLNVLLAAREAGVRRVVFTSSREVYGDPARVPIHEDSPLLPKNLYGASKAAGEMYCRALGNGTQEIVILRLANVYGPRDRDRVIPLFLNAAVQGASLEVYGGEQIIDFVWIGTVVNSLLRVGFGDHVSEPLNIGSGVGVTVLDLAHRILAMVPSTSHCVRLPSRDIEVTRFVADISRARDAIDLPSPAEPLTHLPKLVDQIDREALLLR